MTSRVHGDAKRGMGAGRNTLIRRKINGRDLGEERITETENALGESKKKNAYFVVLPLTIIK